MRYFHFQVRGTRDHILEIMKYDVVNKIWPMTSNEEIKKKTKNAGYLQWEMIPGYRKTAGL